MFYQSILIPIDVSHPEMASAIFEQAQKLLQPVGKITVVHVLPDIPSYVATELPDGVLLMTAQSAEKAIKKIVETAKIDAATKILKGQTSQAILAAGEEVKADLIIVASHRPGLSDYLLGSTAARVVRHAQCSVLVIR